MSSSDSHDLMSIVNEYRAAIEDCQNLYDSCARDCINSRLDLSGQSEGDFCQRMTDLGHGLMLKIFMDIASLDPHWCHEIVVLAGELFEFVWGSRLKPTQLKEALNHFQAENNLSLNELLGPFERLEPFRCRRGQLQTVVMRMANLVAKANGTISPEELRQLRWIQSEMRRLLEPIPLAGDEKEKTEPSGKLAYARASFDVSAAPGAEDVKRPPVEIEEKSPEERLKEGMADLDSLIGLKTIKDEVRSLINFLKVQKAREQFELPKTPISLHHVFSGNPGTGKTSVARIIGRIFGAMGLLAKGHLVETDRSGLVAEYAGQSAQKAHKKIDEALDGVLFIDEAYSLVAEKGDDPYGTEALQVLLKRMEDDRNRLVVVLAGYPGPMKRLLECNPGLSSRFNRHLLFPDYSAVELGQIFDELCRKDRYSLPALARVKLLLGYRYLLEHRDEHFGNGRLVRNVFEQAVGRLANRIAGMTPVTRELLTTLQPTDIDIEGVPANVWRAYETTPHVLHLDCPSCHHPYRLPQEYLGQKVHCRHCQASFEADWGDLVAHDDKTQEVKKESTNTAGA